MFFDTCDILLIIFTLVKYSINLLYTTLELDSYSQLTRFGENVIFNTLAFYSDLPIACIILACCLDHNS